MSLYFECPIETGDMHLDEEGYLLFETAMTLYENPQSPHNSPQEKFSFSLSIRKKYDNFVIFIYPYGNNFTIPRDDLNKLDEIYEFMDNTITTIYHEKLKLWLGEEASIGEHVNFVGWVEARNPTLAGLLGFTYVQPNLLEELIAKLTCTPSIDLSCPF